MEEVKNAVFALSGDSASGPDGFIGLFYQHCWEIIGEDIFMLLQEFYVGATLPESITHTNLVLLPKKTPVQTFSYLRPISLSNFINKVFSRVLHDRMEKILPSLISPNQSGFVKGKSFFKSSRGVKQGDPLSPALFILSAEKVVEVLKQYEQTSGQLINKSKCSYYLHTKVARNLADCVGSMTGFQKGNFPFTYLGCPMFYTRRRKDYYNDLTKKFKAKLHCYKGKLLSFGGKATLITSVLQSLPTHLLSVLDPPNNVLEHLHKMFSIFF
ncbi:uncharacterized protein LOC142167191 [Nicotiana tabacum]|uniref:Uncharacterized protein LOC142167191 n=1 Tax=Nicotiana tabacum TaxID=4097 RepID=A0AC58SEQ0_TOBAC